MPRYKAMPWFPLYSERWLWGSIRDELEHDERAIFTDFLCMAAQTGGYIAANVDDEIPYPTHRLAQMLSAKIELVERTIHKCIKCGKLEQLESGILRIPKWKDYQLSDRYIRKLQPKSEHSSAKTEHSSAKCSPIVEESREEKKIKEENTPVGGDKSPNPYHNRFMGAWVAGSGRYWGSEADKGLRGKAGAQFKRLFYPEFGSFARENPDRVCELIERVWTPDESQTTLERKCCKEGRTVGALTYLARSVLQKERASEQVEQDQKRTEARSRAEMRKLDEETEAAEREADRLAEDKITNPVKWAKCVLVGQDVTEEGLRKLLKSQFILGFYREAAQILLEKLTKQPVQKEA